VPKLLWFSVAAKPKHTITTSPTHNSLPAKMDYHITI